jgi:cytochrome c2
MKKVFKVLGILIALILLSATGFALFISNRGIPKFDPPKVEMKVEVTPERVMQGQKIASMLCVECHADEEGKLTGTLLKDVPKEFGEIYSKNITHHPEVGIGSWTDGELYALLRTGIKRDGQYIPPYMVKFPLASDEDVKSIIAWLRSEQPALEASDREAPESKPSFLTKFLCFVAFKPLEMPKAEIKAPDTADHVANGKYLFTAVYGCFACHSADFKTLNDVEPEKSGGFCGGGNPLLNKQGEVVVSSNLTFDETGIADYTEEDFIKAVKTGVKKDGSQVRYPMVPRSRFTDQEVRDMYAYLKTVPKIANKVKS